jgi:hypothetical protein
VQVGYGDPKVDVTHYAGSNEVPFFASGQGWSNMHTLVLAQANSTVNANGPRAMGLIAQTRMGGRGRRYR